MLPQGGSCRGVVHALHSVLRRFVFKQGRDVAQSGSAPEWGSGGRGFESRRPDHDNSKPPLRLALGGFGHFSAPVYGHTRGTPPRSTASRTFFGSLMTASIDSASGC